MERVGDRIWRLEDMAEELDGSFKQMINKSHKLSRQKEWNTIKRLNLQAADVEKERKARLKAQKYFQ